MRVELLKFKRCCCCLPLRYGLLVSGYLKLMVSLLMLVAFTVSIATELTLILRGVHRPNLSAIVLTGFIILVIMCDIALNIVFLVGGHKKNPRLLRVYNYYSIGVLALCVFSLFVMIVSIIYQLLQLAGYLQTTYMIKFYLSIGLLNIGFQVYMILVNKSEITKLENNHQFRFINNANEAQCSMDEGHNQINETYIKNSEPVDQNVADDENEENYQTENKLRGNYARLG